MSLPTSKPARPSRGACTNLLRRRALLLVAVATAVTPLAGCSAISGPSEITLSERELAERIEREFPRSERLLELIDVRISAPSLQLVPQRNRIASRFDLALRDRVFGSSYRGHIGFESGLRFEASDHSVRLADVKVGTLRLDDRGGRERDEKRQRDDQGGSGVLTAYVAPSTVAQAAQDAPALPLQRIGHLLAEQMLEDHAVWRASPAQVDRLRRSGYEAEAVTVTNDGIRISFRPLAR